MVLKSVEEILLEILASRKSMFWFIVLATLATFIYTNVCFVNNNNEA